MSNFLFEYHPISPTTWVYLSSLVAIGMFFKFGRLWSLRNLDLLMLLAFSPGLLLIYYGYQTQPAEPVSERVASEDSARDGPEEEEISPAAQSANGVKAFGYFWMLGCAGLWLIRMILDPMLVRRPMLNPNVTVGGLAFLGISLFIFLMANVIASPSSNEASTMEGKPVRMDHLIELRQEAGPGYTILNQLPPSAVKTLAILSHLAIAVGLILIGHRHFNNTANGFGAAMLYLLLPYTSQMTGRLDHFVPAAFMIWAVLCYRRPLLSGLSLGVACGCVYCPLFLLPLWISFYWKRGLRRFVAGVVIALTAMSTALVFMPSAEGFWSDLRRMFGVLRPTMQGLQGVWDPDVGGFNPVYRIPLIAVVAVLALSLALWPARKNLGTLISASAAVLLACQFWIGWGGGLYLAWFIPLVLLTVFRPNLENRVAQDVIHAPWFAKRKPRLLAA
ncbi:MAG: hypothetical protein AAGF97_07350 [Planctomycetota bacterium]